MAENSQESNKLKKLYNLNFYRRKDSWRLNEEKIQPVKKPSEPISTDHLKENWKDQEPLVQITGPSPAEARLSSVDNDISLNKPLVAPDANVNQDLPAYAYITINRRASSAYIDETRTASHRLSQLETLAKSIEMERNNNSSSIDSEINMECLSLYSQEDISAAYVRPIEPLTSYWIEEEFTNPYPDLLTGKPKIIQSQVGMIDGNVSMINNQVPMMHRHAPMINNQIPMIPAGFPIIPGQNGSGEACRPHHTPTCVAPPDVPFGRASTNIYHNQPSGPYPMGSNCQHLPESPCHSMNDAYYLTDLEHKCQLLGIPFADPITMYHAMYPNFGEAHMDYNEANGDCFNDWNCVSMSTRTRSASGSAYERPHSEPKYDTNDFDSDRMDHSDDDLSNSSFASFVRHAHGVPHSSQMDLDYTCDPNSLGELKLASLSPRQLELGVKTLTEAVSKLLIESAKRTNPGVTWHPDRKTT